MAVPKKKRYKQIVIMRRSLFKIMLLHKKSLNITKFGSFINFEDKVVLDNAFTKCCTRYFKDCGNYSGNLSNKVCNFCSSFNYI
jgi:hypothetical protein